MQSELMSRSPLCSGMPGRELKCRKTQWFQHKIGPRQCLASRCPLASQMPPRRLPDAPQMLHRCPPNASQMLPRCHQMLPICLPDAAVILPDASPKPPRCPHMTHQRFFHDGASYERSRADTATIRILMTFRVFLFVVFDVCSFGKNIENCK